MAGTGFAETTKSGRRDLMGSLFSSVAADLVPRLGP